MNNVVISNHKQSVIVKGNTYPIKNTLKSLGGSWNSILGGWIFPNGNRDAVVSKLLGMAEVNLTDRTVAVAVSPTSDPERSAHHNVTILNHKQSVIVKGDTYPIKDTLKSLGGSWNSILGGWIFPNGNRDAVVSKLLGMAEVNLTDKTVAVPVSPVNLANRTVAAAVSPTALTKRSAPDDVDDYSNLVSLPTPNRGKFGTEGVPGEMQVHSASVLRQLREIMLNLIHLEGGRIISPQAPGVVFEVCSRRQKEEQRAAEESDDSIPTGGFMPKISIEDSRHVGYERGENFTCDGTMYRHTDVSWEDAPIEFKRHHNVVASKEAPAKSICYEHKIEDLDPFGCEVYWKTVWEKCKSCHEADMAFKKWALRASTPGGMAARKKQKVVEDAQAADTSSAKEVNGQSYGRAKGETNEGNLKSE